MADEPRDESEAQLREILARLGYESDRPADPVKARRWDMPLLWHISDLRDALHALNNQLHILVNLIDRLFAKLDDNARLSQGNAEAIAKVTEISRKICDSAEHIEHTIGVIRNEHPMLMRELYWLDTNPVEIGLIVYTAGEAMVFFNASPGLLTSAMFASLSALCQNPIIWGGICGAISVASVISFISRRHTFRIATAFLNFVYFGITGAVPIALAGGIMGWLPHIIFAAGAAWVLSRGPSHAT
jgi:hypothetical protein